MLSLRFPRFVAREMRVCARLNKFNSNTTMKKTFITILALAGVAAADTITPLAETEGWTYALGRTDRVQWTHDATAATMTMSNNNWGQATATYTFADSITDSWNFSLDVARGSASTAFYLTLVGNTTAVTLGNKDYESGTVYYGTTDNVTATHYAINANWDNGGTNVSGTALVEGAFNNNSVATISGSTILDADSNVILTLNISSTAMTTPSSATTTINLGKNFALNQIKLGADGPNSNVNTWVVSNMTVSYIPEPATATLSLLALAGLAARRRRK